MLVKEGRCEAYNFTITVGCEQDAKILERYRKNVKLLNKRLHENGVAYRVTVHYRKPKQKFVTSDWRSSKPRCSGYNLFGDVIGGASNATEADIYLHRRYN
jgi:hypothetical protein